MFEIISSLILDEKKRKEVYFERSFTLHTLNEDSSKDNVGSYLLESDLKGQILINKDSIQSLRELFDQKLNKDLSLTFENRIINLENYFQDILKKANESQV